MDIRVKQNKKGDWGFVESFKVWNYMNEGYIEAVVGVAPEGKYTEPYVYRAGEFVRASVIEEEMGVAKYIKAKKPFYSLIRGSFIVKIRVRVSFREKKYYEDKSEFTVFYPIKAGDDARSVKLKRMLEVPENIPSLLSGLMKELAETFGDREAFIKGRMGE